MYKKQEWNNYDKTLSPEENAKRNGMITKDNMTHIEEGLYSASKPLEMGWVTNRHSYPESVDALFPNIHIDRSRPDIDFINAYIPPSPEARGWCYIEDNIDLEAGESEPLAEPYEPTEDQWDPPTVYNFKQTIYFNNVWGYGSVLNSLSNYRDLTEEEDNELERNRPRVELGDDEVTVYTVYQPAVTLPLRLRIITDTSQFG